MGRREREFLEYYAKTRGFQGLSSRDLVKTFFPQADLTNPLSVGSYKSSVMVMLKNAAWKLKEALALPSPELTLLLEIDPGLRRLISSLDGLLHDELWLIANQKRQATGWKFSLEKTLKSLIIKEKEKEALEVSLGMRGEYSGFYDYVRKTYLSGQALGSQVRPYHNDLKDARKIVLKKLHKAFFLDQATLNLLLEVEPWYGRIFEICSSFDKVLTKIAEFGHPARRWTDPTNRRKSQSKYLEVPEEKLQEAIAALPSEYQDAAQWCIGLQGNALNIWKYAKQANLPYSWAYKSVCWSEQFIDSFLSGKSLPQSRPFQRVGARVMWRNVFPLAILLSGRELPSRESASGKVGWPVPISDRERELIQVSLGFMGEYNSLIEYITQTYAGLIDSVQKIPQIYREIAGARHGALQKLEWAYRLEEKYRILLSQTEPFYKLVFERYPRIEDIQSLFEKSCYKAPKSAVEGLVALIPKERVPEVLTALPVVDRETAGWFFGAKDQLGTVREFAEKAGISYVGAYSRFRRMRERIELVLAGKAIKQLRYPGSLALYRQDVLSIPEISDKEVNALSPILKAGDREEQERVYLASLRYVFSAAASASYIPQVAEKGFAFLDLVQEGNIGLLKAVRKFRYNPENGSRWSNYARAVAKFAIRARIAGSPKRHLIRIPLSRQAQIRKYIQAQLKLCEELERYPTVEEVAETVGVNVEVARRIQEAMSIYGASTVSLQAPVFPGAEAGDSPTWAEILPAQKSGSDQDEGEANRLRAEFIRERLERFFIEVLTSTEEYVLKLSFGFEGEELHDEEVATEIGLSLREVRLLKSRALNKLRRHPEIARWLKHLT